MKRTVTMLLLSIVACILLYTPLEARKERCCYRYSRGASAAGFFAGAFAGAAIAGAYDRYPPPYYWGYGPRPLYAYDYPAAAYYPWYADQVTAWSFYPFGY